MSSTKRLAAGAFALVGVAVLLYSLLVTHQLLLGAGVALSFFVVALFLYYGGTDRRTLVRATMAITVVYGVFTLQLPIAVAAACVVYLTAWLTGPDSPVDAPDTHLFPTAETDTDTHEPAIDDALDTADESDADETDETAE